MLLLSLLLCLLVTLSIASPSCVGRNNRCLPDGKMYQQCVNNVDFGLALNCDALRAGETAQTHTTLVCCESGPNVYCIRPNETCPLHTPPPPPSSCTNGQHRCVDAPGTTGRYQVCGNDGPNSPFVFYNFICQDHLHCCPDRADPNRIHCTDRACNLI